MANRDEHVAAAREAADQLSRTALTSPAFMPRALHGVLHALLAQLEDPTPTAPKRTRTTKPTEKDN